MLEKLEADRTKIPSPSREEMIKLMFSAWEQVNVDFPSSAFKKNFVTSALNGSEDYLVSDRQFNFIGEDMRQFREKLLKWKIPETIQALVRTIIPPKGIRWKNIEGAELLDFTEEFQGIDTAEVGNEDDIPDASDSEEEEIPQIVPVPNTPPNEVAAAVLSVVTLGNICNDEQINKDARLLDILAQVFDEHETSVQFLPHLNKMMSAYHDARASVKRRISNHVSNPQIPVEEHELYQQDEPSAQDESCFYQQDEPSAQAASTNRMNLPLKFLL